MSVLGATLNIGSWGTKRVEKVHSPPTQPGPLKMYALKSKIQTLLYCFKYRIYAAFY